MDFQAAVARAAFRELASGLPSGYAVVAEGPTRASPWARGRIAAFRACCRKDGKPCRVFPERNGEDESQRLARLQRWVAALPPHCAIFAVNDLVASEVASALASAAKQPAPPEQTPTFLPFGSVPTTPIVSPW